jgi:EpsI family protein
MSSGALPSAADQTSRRQFVVGGGLLAAALFASRGSWPGSPDQEKAPASLDTIVPEQLGRWRSSPANGVVIPTAEVPDDTGYDSLLTRYYLDDNGRTIMFLVAYGSAQAGGTQLHRPEACYPAAGFKLLDPEPVIIGSGGEHAIHGRAITGVKPGRTEQILYWSRVGTAFPTSSAEQSLATLRQSLRGRAPDGALIRMSTLASERTGALAILHQFANALLEQPQPALRRLLIGAA